MKIRRYFLFALTMVLSLTAFSQESTNGNKSQFLLDPENGIQISGFGGPIFELSQIDNDLAVCTGAGGAVLFNQQFFIGGYGMGQLPVNGNYSFNIREVLGAPLHQYANLSPIFAHGGLWMGYIHESHKIVHLGLSARMGWGTLAFADLNYNFHDSEIGIDPIFVVSPQAEIEFNMLKWFKINLGLGYRYVGGVDATYINADNKTVRFYDKNSFNSLTGSLTFLFGGFERK